MGYKIERPSNLTDRIKKCVEFRHSQNPATEEFRTALNDHNHPFHSQAIKELMYNASAAACMADLAGVSIEHVLGVWATAMEERHPEILKDNDTAHTQKGRERGPDNTQD